MLRASTGVPEDAIIHDSALSKFRLSVGLACFILPSQPPSPYDEPYYTPPVHDHVAPGSGPLTGLDWNLGNPQKYTRKKKQTMTKHHRSIRTSEVSHATEQSHIFPRCSCHPRCHFGYFTRRRLLNFSTKEANKLCCAAYQLPYKPSLFIGVRNDSFLWVVMIEDRIPRLHHPR